MPYRVPPPEPPRERWVRCRMRETIVWTFMSTIASYMAIGFSATNDRPEEARVALSYLLLLLGIAVALSVAGRRLRLVDYGTFSRVVD